MRVSDYAKQAMTFSFVGGETGEWQVDRIIPVIGETLPGCSRLMVLDGAVPLPETSSWALKGATSNARYTKREELTALSARQSGLGRPEALCAALIPIRKTASWWALAQDERREIMEERSHHIRIGLDYLPAVSRRLHHCREFGEPFDFLTWFEYPPDHADGFDEMVTRLRATEEWRYVDREVDIRLMRQA